MEEFDSNCGIYEIVNKVNGKRYIGSAVDIKKRWWEHRKDLRRNKHQNYHLQKSWNKHGEDNFEFKVLSYLYYPETLIPIEQLYLDKFWHEGLYNICPTAGSTLGITYSDEARKKQSEARKKYFENPEARKQISDATKKRWESPEARKKLSEQAKKQYESPEARKKTSDAAKKRWESPEARKQMSEVKKKQLESPEARKQISDASKKNWENPEFRAKYAATIEKRRQAKLLKK